MGKAAPWLHDLSQGKVSFSLCFSFKITLEGTRWVSRLRICSGHGPGAGVWLEPASSSVPPSPAHHSCSLSLFFSNKGCILKKNKIPLRAAPPPTPHPSTVHCRVPKALIIDQEGLAITTLKSQLDKFQLVPSWLVDTRSASTPCCPTRSKLDENRDSLLLHLHRVQAKPEERPSPAHVGLPKVGGAAGREHRVILPFSECKPQLVKHFRLGRQEPKPDF